MKQSKRNIKLYARTTRHDVISIYLDCSGRRELLMEHRYVPRLYGMLKDGIRLEELRRSKDAYKFHHGERRGSRRRKRSQTLENSIRYLIRAADDFLEHDINVEAA